MLYEGYEHSTVHIKFQEVDKRDIVNVDSDSEPDRPTAKQTVKKEQHGNRPISPTSPPYSPAD